MPRNFKKELEAQTDTKNSVDQQIDRMLIEFEKGAAGTSDLEEVNHFNLQHNALKEIINEMLLLEAPEDEPDPPEDEDPADADPAADPGEGGGDELDFEGGEDDDIEALLGGGGGGGAGMPSGGGMGGGGGGGPAGDPGGSEDESDKGKEEKPEEMPIEKKPMLDIDGFASSVARLAENYDDLLSVRDVVINRAVQFVEKNYDEDTAFVLKQSLKFNFSL